MPEEERKRLLKVDHVLAGSTRNQEEVLALIDAFLEMSLRHPKSTVVLLIGTERDVTQSLRMIDFKS